MAEEVVMMVCTDVSNNNNKFYELTLQGDEVTARFGRVGQSGQVKKYSGGKAQLEALIREKTKAKKDGSQYRRVERLAGGENVKVGAGSSVNSAELVRVAKKQLVGEAVGVLAALVEDLTKVNRHQIMEMSGGQIQVDESGLVKTAVGLVTSSAIKEAQKLLNDMSVHVSKGDVDASEFLQMVNGYLMRVPQAVGLGRGWHRSFVGGVEAIQKQAVFLDQLLASVESYEKSLVSAAQAKVDSGEVVEESVFKTKLELVEDVKVIAEVEKFYRESLNKGHACSHMKLKRVYRVVNEEWEKRFEAKSVKVGNVKRLWHGTRMFNVLSILKSGLIIPVSQPGSSFQITGRMFGDGVYFSDQSSKSLNYSYGYWDRGAKDNRCFMFLADVAMGKSHTPKGPTGTLPRGYDSMYAVGGQSGVANNEMIVYSLDQAVLKYLCEFEG